MSRYSVYIIPNTFFVPRAGAWEQENNHLSWNYRKMTRNSLCHTGNLKE